MNEQPDIPGIATAPELEAKLLADIVKELRTLPSFVGGEYADTWCDLVADIQEGEDYFFDNLWRDTILAFLAVLIRRMAPQDRERLWSTTEAGWDYDFEKRWQQGAEPPDNEELAKLHHSPDEQVEDIARHARKELYLLAERANLQAEIQAGKRAHQK